MILFVFSEQQPYQKRNAGRTVNGSGKTRISDYRRVPLKTLLFRSHRIEIVGDDLGVLDPVKFHSAPEGITTALTIVKACGYLRRLLRIILHVDYGYFDL